MNDLHPTQTQRSTHRPPGFALTLIVRPSSRDGKPKWLASQDQPTKDGSAGSSSVDPDSVETTGPTVTSSQTPQRLRSANDANLGAGTGGKVLKPVARAVSYPLSDSRTAAAQANAEASAVVEANAQASKLVRNATLAHSHSDATVGRPPGR